MNEPNNDRKRSRLGGTDLRLAYDQRVIVDGLSVDVPDGAITAIVGANACGKSTLLRALARLLKPQRGRVLLDGQELSVASPRDAIRAGICLLTEDRKRQGLVLNRSVLENFGLPNMSRFASAGVIRLGEELSAFERYIEQLRIKVPHAGQRAQNLSGGNQQKVVLAKWLERDAEVIIFDEPTRGIDVGAKYEIYVLMQKLAEQGKAILMISSELPEVLGMADRIIVMHEGRVTGEIADARAATQEAIMDLAVR